MAIVPKASRRTDPGGRVSRATARSRQIQGAAPLAFTIPNVRQQSAPRPIFGSARGATPDAFGASIGRGLQDLGAGVQSFANSLQQIELEEQETELKTLDVEFNNRVRSLMYGDPDTDTEGYLSTQGDFAVDGYVPLRDAITQAREELIASGGSKKVRDRATVAFARRTNQAFTQAAQHATTARQKQAVAISEARVANAKNNVANDPDTLADGLATVAMETETLLAKQGQPEEVIDNEIQEQQSDLLQIAITSALGRDDPQQAASILRSNAELMTATDRAKASLNILGSLTVHEAQTIFDELIAEGLTGKDLIEAGRERASGDTRTMLISLIDKEGARDRTEVTFGQGQEDRARAEIVDEELRNIVDEVEDPKEQAALLEQMHSLDPEKFTPTVVRMLEEKLASHNTRQRAIETQDLLEAEAAASTFISEGSGTFDEFRAQNPGYAAQLNKNPGMVQKFRAMSKAQTSGEVYATGSNGKTLLTPNEVIWPGAC